MAIYENVNGVIKTLAESGGGLRGVSNITLSFRGTTHNSSTATAALPSGCTPKFIIYKYNNVR